MIEYEYDRVGQKVYYEKLTNGLEVYIIPNPDKKNYYVNIGTTYGSNDLEFIPLGKDDYIKTPLGVAHFLEHKLFEVEEGIDPFSFYAKSGTGINAGTNYWSTRYYLWGTRDLEKNVDYLLNLVYKPYFTKENVLKEQGIIAEEIKMYDDDPAWILDNTTRKCLFQNNNSKYKIAGTVESIQEITEDILYDSYYTFYQPSNMVLIIGGNVQLEKIMKVIKNNKALKEAKTNTPIKLKNFHEPDEVAIENLEIKANIVLPKLRYSFKINLDRFSLKEKIKARMYLNCIFSLLLGSTSDFYEKVRKEGITTGYYADHGRYDNFFTLEIEAESRKPEIFKKMVDETLQNIKVTEKELERLKKVWIASEIRISDNYDVLVDNLFDDLVYYKKHFFDRIEIIKSLNIQELNTIIQELDLKNHTFVLMNPAD